VSRRAAQAASIDPPPLQVLLEEVTEDVVSDLARDRRRNPVAREDDCCVCRTAPGCEEEVPGRTELAGSREAWERRDKEIGHDDPGAEDEGARRCRHRLPHYAAPAAISSPLLRRVPTGSGKQKLRRLRNLLNQQIDPRNLRRSELLGLVERD
jgi:hypothetical protein